MMMEGNAKVEHDEAEKIAAVHLIDANRFENAAVEKELDLVCILLLEMWRCGLRH
jgi:hypothetical protein